MNYAVSCLFSFSFLLSRLLRITLQKYLNYFADYHTFLLNLIDWIAFELFLTYFFGWKLAVFVCIAQHREVWHCCVRAPLISFSLFSRLSFFCFRPCTLSLSFVFPRGGAEVVSVWRQKLALFFLGGKPRAHFRGLLGHSQRDKEGHKGGRGNTINLTDLSRWLELTFRGRLAFPKAHLELADKIVHVFFFKNFYLFFVFWTPGTCRGHTN